MDEKLIDCCGEPVVQNPKKDKKKEDDGWKSVTKKMTMSNKEEYPIQK